MRTFFLAAGSFLLASFANGQCGKPIVRPEIRSLSAADRARFFKAVGKLKEAGDLDRLSKIHFDNSETIHGHPVFLAFHRIFTNDFALSLNKVDPGVPFPYWDWSLDATHPAESVVFTSEYCGGNGKGPQHCVEDGPFANWKMDVEASHCLARNFNQGSQISPFWPPEALLSMQKTCSQYGALSSGIENGCHGAVHLGISGDMSTMYAPNDAFFFLHHGMIDKLWYDWQLMEPNTRFQMYDNVNYNDPPVSPDDVMPAYPKLTVKDALDPRKTMCYVYEDSGAHAATKRLMDEIDKQAAAKKDGAPPPSSSDTATSPPPPSTNSDPASNSASGAPPPPSSGSSGSSPGGPSAQLNALTAQASRLSGTPDERANAMDALHHQQMRFLQNTILNGMAGGGGANGNGFDFNSFFQNSHHFLRRADPAAKPATDPVTGLVSGLLGPDGLVSHVLSGVGHLVEVLPKGLEATLKAVGGIAENVTDDVLGLLHIPKFNISAVPEKDRRIPYVAAMPDWWIKRNNLNATVAADLHKHIHGIIDGFNSIPGYYSPAVIHYASKKYASKK